MLYIINFPATFLLFLIQFCWINSLLQPSCSPYLNNQRPMSEMSAKTTAKNNYKQLHLCMHNYKRKPYCYQPSYHSWGPEVVLPFRGKDDSLPSAILDGKQHKGLYFGLRKLQLYLLINSNLHCMFPSTENWYSLLHALLQSLPHPSLHKNAFSDP